MKSFQTISGRIDNKTSFFKTFFQELGSFNFVFDDQKFQCHGPFGQMVIKGWSRPPPLSKD